MSAISSPALFTDKREGKNVADVARSDRATGRSPIR